jgi:hypothetical protein
MGRWHREDEPADERERAHAVAEAEALVRKLPVTGGGPDSRDPSLEVMLAVRDEARDLLKRGRVTPREVDRLWQRLPRYWRRQFTNPGVVVCANCGRRTEVGCRHAGCGEWTPVWSPPSDVRRVRAIDPGPIVPTKRGREGRRP